MQQHATFFFSISEKAIRINIAGPIIRFHNTEPEFIMKVQHGLLPHISHTIHRRPKLCNSDAHSWACDTIDIIHIHGDDWLDAQINSSFKMEQACFLWVLSDVICSNLFHLLIMITEHSLRQCRPYLRWIIKPDTCPITSNYHILQQSRAHIQWWILPTSLSNPSDNLCLCKHNTISIVKPGLHNWIDANRVVTISLLESFPQALLHQWVQSDRYDFASTEATINIAT